MATGTHDGPDLDVPWSTRAAARAGIDERTRTGSNRPANQIVEAAIGLSAEKGSAFTI